MCLARSSLSAGTTWGKNAVSYPSAIINSVLALALWLVWGGAAFETIPVAPLPPTPWMTVYPLISTFLQGQDLVFQPFPTDNVKHLQGGPLWAISGARNPVCVAYHKRGNPVRNAPLFSEESGGESIKGSGYAKYRTEQLLGVEVKDCQRGGYCYRTSGKGLLPLPWNIQPAY